ncbi:S-adenosyl-L-methionine-dependent methyltransferase [Schizothecium vesticola]|uniref:S-adenosyl-L-methionine-dependent methyltransferase n=1 Tax=Schizothecium vesticola TaxID=314040 RepID=A0AA40F7G7_9PEZI|nr:S-adenosyl-L-methionine-dependent methyltransferase [Schizothecium vesticola]
MPRLPPSLFWRAHQISPHAPNLLLACRDLPSTALELRWIKDHITTTPSTTTPPFLRLAHLIRLRARGLPLQYVLGTQPFGTLTIRCRRGVLIPRPETESYTLELADVLFRTPTRSLTVVDLCTGTGCIPLQLFASLRARFPSLAAHGVDVAPGAVALARENARQLGPLGAAQGVTFHRASIFSPAAGLPPFPAGEIDLLTANPPYISRGAFARSTARSVRNHEPRLALVPDGVPASVVAALGCEAFPEDVFYARILELCRGWRPKRVFLEVADGEQAGRVFL